MAYRAAAGVRSTGRFGIAFAARRDRIEGIEQQQAREKGFKLKIGRMPMTSVARAIERDETAGLMKLVVDASNDMILGVSILAPEAGEIVQILGTLMLAKQPYTLLKGAVFIHPTLAEGFFGLMESVAPVS